MLHHVIIPNLDCYRLKHQMIQRLKQPGPGVYDICTVCSTGYSMALARFGGDETAADNFVRSLRQETSMTLHAD